MSNVPDKFLLMWIEHLNEWVDVTGFEEDLPDAKEYLLSTPARRAAGDMWLFIDWLANYKELGNPNYEYTIRKIKQGARDVMRKARR